MYLVHPPPCLCSSSPHIRKRSSSINIRAPSSIRRLSSIDLRISIIPVNFRPHSPQEPTLVFPTLFVCSSRVVLIASSRTCTWFNLPVSLPGNVSPLWAIIRVSSYLRFDSSRFDSWGFVRLEEAPRKMVSFINYPRISIPIAGSRSRTQEM